MESYSDPSQNFVLDPYQPQNLESDDSNPSQDLKPVFNPPQNVEWDFKPSPLDPLPNIPDSEFQESQISEFKLDPLQILDFPDLDIPEFQIPEFDSLKIPEFK